MEDLANNLDLKFDLRINEQIRQMLKMRSAECGRSMAGHIRYLIVQDYLQAHHQTGYGPYIKNACGSSCMTEEEAAEAWHKVSNNKEPNT
jgi:hypothetical protein